MIPPFPAILLLKALAKTIAGLSTGAIASGSLLRTLQRRGLDTTRYVDKIQSAELKDCVTELEKIGDSSILITKKIANLTNRKIVNNSAVKEMTSELNQIYERNIKPASEKLNKFYQEQMETGRSYRHKLKGFYSDSRERFSKVNPWNKTSSNTKPNPPDTKVKD